MRIIQLLPTLSYGDAVGNDAVAIHHILKELGYETKIYAENVDTQFSRDIADYYRHLPKLKKTDCLLYHFSIGSDVMPELLQKTPCEKVMVYHNITPGIYFKQYKPEVEEIVKAGRSQLQELRPLFSVCLAVSEYNRQDLLQMGYTCPIFVLPILIPFSDYGKEPSALILDRYPKDDMVNVLFVGRIAPNKKIEDVIQVFAYYKQNYQPNSRLFLIGQDRVADLYTDRLRRYIDGLGMRQEILLSGHIPFNQILAYYRLADVFLCMSDHEGFCVPLLEAMHFSLPIVAFSAAAVPETLGEAGILVDTRLPALPARALHEAVQNRDLRRSLQEAGKKRLADFAYDVVKKDFEILLQKILSHDDTPYQCLASKHSRPNVEAQELVAAWKKELSGKDAVMPLPFSDVPIEEGAVASMTTSQRLKRRILKPIYQEMHRYAPRLADSIRLGLYRMARNIRFSPQKLELLENRRPGLLVDVSYITGQDHGTGIQRVVNNVYQEIHAMDLSVLAIQKRGGEISTAYAYMNRREGRRESGDEKRIEFQKGDTLLCLDSSWDYYREFSSILDAAAAAKVEVYDVVYDLFPIQYPEVAASSLFSEVFTHWHDMMFQRAKGILCISRTTADVVADYVEQKKIQRKTPLDLYYFHLGGEPTGTVGKVRQELQRYVRRRKTFLMVGTVEPRKGHMVVLEALKSIMSHEKVQLLILGHNGWKNDEIRTLLRPGGPFHDRVLWIQDASDHELHWAYQNTEALIAASKDEGYGLPLMEAAYFGLPILCSDIPIFHEVTEDYATFFKVLDAKHLAVQWRAWLHARKHPDSRKIPRYTWTDSAREVLNIVEGRAKPYRTLSCGAIVADAEAK